MGATREHRHCMIGVATLLALCAAPRIAAQNTPVRFGRLTVSDGLSQENVYCVLQDSKGFMWFGTQFGLNRYDGVSIETFNHNPFDDKSLSGDWILSLAEDDRGGLWIGTHSAGLNRLDPATGVFQRFSHDPQRSDSLAKGQVWSLLTDRRGNLWIGTMNGLCRLDLDAYGRTGKSAFRHYVSHPEDSSSVGGASINALYEDADGFLWVGAFDGGLSRYEHDADAFERYPYDADAPVGLSHGRVKSIAGDRFGNIWIGLMGGGLNRYSPRTKEFTHYTHVPGDAESLGGDYIRALAVDENGDVWAGSGENGLSRFNPRTGGFLRYTANSNDRYSLVDNSIHCLYSDRSGVLWIGAEAGLSKYNTRAKKFRAYVADAEAPERGLNGNQAVSVYVDWSDTVWVGLIGGGLNKIQRELNRYTHFTHDPNDPESISGDDVTAIIEDVDNHLWIGTRRGLNRLKRTGDRFQRFVLKTGGGDEYDNISALCLDLRGELWVGFWGRGLHRIALPGGDAPIAPGQLDLAEAPGGLAEGEITFIKRDRGGRLWIGTRGDGLAVVDPEAVGGDAPAVARYFNDPNSQNSLSNNNVAAFYEDETGLIWIGLVGGGLNKFDRKTGQISHYLERDGLPSNAVNGIVSDDRGFLWIASQAGLCRMNPETGEFRTFDVADGLQSNELNGAFFKSPRGEIFSGSSEGLVSYFPNQIKDNPEPPPVVFTGFKIFNKDAELPGGIGAAETIRLDYKQYAFTVEFAALDYAVPEKNRYYYKLEGYNPEWIDLGSRNFVPFFNLPPDEYVLRVRGANSDGVYNDAGASLRLVIVPPPWRQWWAYLIYIAAAAGVAALYIRAQARKLKRERYVAERLKRANEQLKLSDKIKDEFLANTSHELRTPLNGMIGIADSMIDGAAGPLSDQQVSNLSMIVSSGMRLSNLVNDILDFSKLRRRNIELNRRAVDLYPLAHLVLSLNKPLLRGKPIRIVNRIDPELPPVYADEGRLEQVMHNLVGNAIKFTERGKIEVSAEKTGDLIRVSVADTGVGIPEKRRDRIFESFEQADGADERVYGGAGLGLAITKKLVELHEGELGVVSEPGSGSTFFFTMPLAPNTAAIAAERRPEAKKVHEGILKLSEGILKKSDDAAFLKPNPNPADPDFHILMVDDEPINLQVLTNFLSVRNYAITQAHNGREALDIIEGGQRFDLVLLDVMMPKMSGYEVCKRIRRKQPAHELPIVMLTAKNQAGDVVTGFEAGANDYVVKPVSKNELLVRLNTHLNLLKTSRKLKISNQKLEEYSRNLEKIVEQRTLELQERNAELETLDEIVRAINREVELGSVLEAILEEARAVIPNAEDGAFLARDRQTGRLITAAPWDSARAAGQAALSQEELADALGVSAGSLADQTFAARPKSAVWAPAGTATPKAALSMPVILDGVFEGVLILTSNEREDAFGDTAVGKLRRLEGHAESAFGKARVLEEVRLKNQELVTAQKNLIQQEKMAYLGKLTAGIAHEIQNPLNFVTNFASVAVELAGELSALCGASEPSREDLADLRAIAGDLGENVALIERHGKRAERIVRGMMMHSKDGSQHREPVRVADLLDEQFDLALHGFKAKGEPLDIELERNYDEKEPPIRVMPREIVHAVQNLLSNAFHALTEKKRGQGGPFQPSLRFCTSLRENFLEFRIRDNGVGVAEENMDKLFTPFFTTRSDGESIGLGLYICYDIIVHGHQGRIEAVSEEGSFTEFAVALPR